MLDNTFQMDHESGKVQKIPPKKKKSKKRISCPKHNVIEIRKIEVNTSQILTLIYISEKYMNFVSSQSMVTVDMETFAGKFTSQISVQKTTDA